MFPPSSPTLSRLPSPCVSRLRALSAGASSSMASELLAHLVALHPTLSTVAHVPAQCAALLAALQQARPLLALTASHSTSTAARAEGRSATLSLIPPHTNPTAPSGAQQSRFACSS